MKRPEIVWIWRTLARTPPAYCYHNFCANFGKSASCSANTLLHVYSLPQDGTPQPKFFKKEEKRVTIRLMGNQLVVVVDGKVQDSAAVGTHNPVRCTRRQTSRIEFVELAGCCKQCVARPFLQRVCLVNKRPHDVYPLQSVSYIVLTTTPYIVLVSRLKFPSFPTTEILSRTLDGPTFKTNQTISGRNFFLCVGIYIKAALGEWIRRECIKEQLGAPTKRNIE
jgi:hypothetical protein